MIRVIAAAIVLWCALVTGAHAQGQQCRTSPVGASTSNCASEAFVTQSAAGGVTSIDSTTGAFTIGGLLSRIGNLLQVLAASKSDEQAGTSAVLATTPSQQQQHDSAAKVWVSFNGAAANCTGPGGMCNLSAAYNANVTRNSAGNYTAAFAVSFATANYACFLASEGTFLVAFISKGAGSINFTTNNISGTPTDSTADLGCFGRQ